MLIEYIGLKARKADNVAGTGLVWVGAGDAHDVADRAAAFKLLAHVEIWRLKQANIVPALESFAAVAAPAPTPAPTPAAAPAGPTADELAAKAAAAQAQDEAAKQSAIPEASKTEAPANKWVLVDDAAGKTIVLDAMNLEQLQALEAEAGLKVDGRIKDLDKRRAAVYAAATGREA